MMTMAAVGAAEADGYLVALPPAARPTARTLADVLVPEQQDMVTPALVEAVLESIALSDSDVLLPIQSGVPPDVPVVTTRAQFSYGPHLGARPKAAPEFMGATSRATRRRVRLAELDRQIAEVKRQRSALAAELGLVEEALTGSKPARRELPRMAPVVEQALRQGRRSGGPAGRRPRPARRSKGGPRRQARGAGDAHPAARRAAADGDMPVGADEVKPWNAPWPSSSAPRRISPAPPRRGRPRRGSEGPVQPASTASAARTTKQPNCSRKGRPLTWPATWKFASSSRPAGPSTSRSAPRYPRPR